VCPVWARGTPSPLSIHFPIFCSFYFSLSYSLSLLSYFFHPFPIYPNIPTPFPGQAAGRIGGDWTWVVFMAAPWKGKERKGKERKGKERRGKRSIYIALFWPRWYKVDGCLPYFYTWCGPSANLECRSQMCCTWFAGDAGRKKSPKIRHLRTIAQLCRAISSQLRHVSTIGQKLVNQQYLLHMSSQYGERRPNRVWHRFVSLGHRSKF